MNETFLMTSDQTHLINYLNGNTSIKTTLPETITSIGRVAFASNMYLEQINIYGIINLIDKTVDYLIKNRKKQKVPFV